MINSPSDMILLTPATPIPLGQFKAEFLALYQPPASKATLAKLEQIFRLIEGLGVETTDRLDAPLITRFIASRPPDQSPHTLRGLLIQLRVICYYAEARRFLAVSPFRLRKLSKWVKVRPPAGKRHQSREEIRRLLDALRANTEGRPAGWPLWRARRIYALVATTVYTAMRAKEAQRLWVEDVDLEAGIINLVPRGVERLKTPDSAQPLVIPRALKPILGSRLGTGKFAR
jgi:integrase